MPMRNVFLSEQSESYITAGIEDGRYSDASEAVGEALQLLRERDSESRSQIHWLSEAVKTGLDEIDRGEGLEFASIDDLAKHIHTIGKEVSEELAAGTARG